MKNNVIVFDGECNLCNGVVGWLLKFAPNGLFQMVAFQSPLGQELLKHHGFPNQQLETVILFDENGQHVHSDGFLRILSKIPKWQLVGSTLSYVPRIVRDNIYIIAAKNRVKWFGKSQTCAVSF
ncbi:thiol-disulfide oxidoreductase DCC family protein [Flagellimonas sp. 2504JD4-2]